MWVLDGGGTSVRDGFKVSQRRAGHQPYERLRAASDGLRDSYLGLACGAAGACAADTGVCCLVTGAATLAWESRLSYALLNREAQSALARSRETPVPATPGR